MHPGNIIGIIALALIIVALVLGTGRIAKYVQPDGRVIVRCSAGHLFETLWVPLGSFKAIRLGNVRYQHCPAGKHWAIVRPVDPTTLTEEELAEARSVKDAAVP